MSRSTITDMMGNCGLLLTPLADALGRFVLKASKVSANPSFCPHPQWVNFRLASTSSPRCC